MIGATSIDHHQGCGCHHWGPPMRMCRRDSKELLVEDTGSTRQTGNTGAAGSAANTVEGAVNVAGDQAILSGGTSARAVIGGGCCVSLSVEYMPSNPSLTTTAVAAVDVVVRDSAGAVLAWGREFKEGYHVQECIITTKPGAILNVRVSNAIARVRWCEIFSC
jgi:hypothetical protein